MNFRDMTEDELEAAMHQHREKIIGAYQRIREDEEQLRSLSKEMDAMRLELAAKNLDSSKKPF